MCTVIWTPRPGGYGLYFNRDERRTRSEARRPASEVHTSKVNGGVRYLAPRDPVGGGTWILVNENGWTVCLLNSEVGGPLENPEGRISRGLLVAGLAGIHRFEDVEEVADPSRYRPFTLLVVDPRGVARGLRSNGDELKRVWTPDPPLLASSSWDECAVEEVRERLWRESRLSAEGGVEGSSHADAMAFMTSHGPERGPASPCMHRPDAQTVSLTVVEVDQESVSMAYSDGPPCRHPLEKAIRLPRERCSTVQAS